MTETASQTCQEAKALKAQVPLSSSVRLWIAASLADEVHEISG